MNILQGLIFDFFTPPDKLEFMEKTFNEKVYDTVARIPYGRVASFGQIAQMIGRPRMARFVGYASNNKASWDVLAAWPDRESRDRLTEEYRNMLLAIGHLSATPVRALLRQAPRQVRPRQRRPPAQAPTDPTV